MKMEDIGSYRPLRRQPSTEDFPPLILIWPQKFGSIETFNHEVYFWRNVGENYITESLHKCGELF